MRESDWPAAPLDPLRAKIDALDEKIVALLNERARIVIEVGKIKQQSNAPIYAPDREKAILERIRQLNKGPLPDRCLEAVWRELMSGSFALEKPLRIGFLGPKGTFSHGAAVAKFGSSVDYHELSDIPSVFDEVVRGHADYGMVPVENSILFYQALTRHKVPAEMYLFEQGPHGMGMLDNLGTASAWPKRAEEWLRARGLLVTPTPAQK